MLVAGMNFAPFRQERLDDLEITSVRSLNEGGEAVSALWANFSSGLEEFLDHFQVSAIGRQCTYWRGQGNGGLEGDERSRSDATHPEK